jgi:hypothetical protein
MSWVNVGIAAVGIGTSLFGANKASKAAKKAAKAQKALLGIESQERMRAMYRSKQQLLGVQQTGYAAAGVAVDVGTPKDLETEQLKDFAQASYYEAMKLQYSLKGATAAGQAASSGYLTQGIGSALNFAQAGYSGYKSNTT